jgi:RNA polymerase sigma-70 factor (ECF subfamily)
MAPIGGSRAAIACAEACAFAVDAADEAGVVGEDRAAGAGRADGDGRPSPGTPPTGEPPPTKPLWGRSCACAGLHTRALATANAPMRLKAALITSSSLPFRVFQHPSFGVFMTSTDETAGPVRFVLEEGCFLDRLERAIVDLLPRLRRLARALSRDMADADDLVQLTVERALVRRSQWRPGTRLDSWMFRIMKNAWIDESRSRRRRATLLAPEEEGLNAGLDGAGALEARLEARAVEEAMARLPDDQRLAIALVLVEGLSYKEAAEVLDVPQGTLTSRLGRGRATLLTQLEDPAS